MHLLFMRPLLSDFQYDVHPQASFINPIGTFCPTRILRVFVVVQARTFSMPYAIQPREAARVTNSLCLGPSFGFTDTLPANDPCRTQKVLWCFSKGSIIRLLSPANASRIANGHSISTMSSTDVKGVTPSASVLCSLYPMV